MRQKHRKSNPDRETIDLRPQRARIDNIRFFSELVLVRPDKTDTMSQDLHGREATHVNEGHHSANSLCSTESNACSGTIVDV